MQPSEHNSLNSSSAASPVFSVQDTQSAGLLQLHHSPLIRSMYLAAGFIALTLGAIGVILPILPTTPFVLLAAACFARGSERFHTKLMTNRYTGPVILEWRLHRSITRKTKRLAYIMTALSFSVSILIVPEMWQKIMLLTIASILAFFLARIPVRENDTESNSLST